MIYASPPDYFLKVFSKQKDKKKYIDFIYNLYKDDKDFSDMNLVFVKNFLYQEDDFAKKCFIVPFGIIDVKSSELKLVGMYILPPDSEYIYLSFLEFKQNSQYYIAVALAYSYEFTNLNKYKNRKVIVGINGHISYGLGILVNKYNTKFEFNSNYNKPYYTKELDDVLKIKKRAFSYIYNANNSSALFNKDLLDNIHSTFTFRQMDKTNFKKEMLLFGDLCHKCLSSTPYYSYKSPQEMYQLMNKMKFLLKNEDLIFVMHKNKEIGFVLSHPDYAEFFSKPKINYIKLLFNLKFKKAEKVIYNVIGVLPEYQKTGLAIALIEYSMKFRKDFKYGVSSFILEDNKESNNLCKKLSTGINKEYRLYEFKPDDFFNMVYRELILSFKKPSRHRNIQIPRPNWDNIKL